MAGRPKRVFTEDEKAKIEQMALNNCHFETISIALEIPVNTLKRHYGRFIRQKRAEGRTIKMQQQYNDKSPTMLIWWGKQHLDQTDKQVIEHEETQQQKQLTEAQQAKVDRFLKFEREQSIRPHKVTG